MWASWMPLRTMTPDIGTAPLLVGQGQLLAAVAARRGYDPAEFPPNSAPPLAGLRRGTDGWPSGLRHRS